MALKKRYLILLFCGYWISFQSLLSYYDLDMTVNNIIISNEKLNTYIK